MCILIHNGTPRRVAFTSEEAFWDDPVSCVQELAIEQHLSMSIKDMIAEVREIVYEEMVDITCLFHEPIRFDERDRSREENKGHRTNGKGGWIARNRGHKPEYKDRRLRAAGSGKTRNVPTLEWKNF